VKNKSKFYSNGMINIVKDSVKFGIFSKHNGNYKRIKFILFIFIPVILYSCSKKSSIEDKITGNWMIENMEYLDTDYKDSLNYNMFFFKKDSRGKVVKVPEISHYEKELSTWEIIKKDDSYFIKINSNNKILNRYLKISFIKNSEKKLLGAKFTSDSLVIEAYKFSKDYLLDGINW
jgi:hypothetical protein